MESTVETFVVYFTRVAPGLALGAIMLLLARRQPRLRIVIYLALFALLRDAMTPLGLWSFGTQGLFWIRLSSDQAFMLAFGLACLGLTLAVYFFDTANRPLFYWVRGKPSLGLAWGFGGAAL